MDIFSAEAITLRGILTAIGIGVTCALLTSLVLAAVEAIRTSQNYVQSALAIFLALAGFGIPISIVAFVSGYMTGSSRTGAVGNLVPAALTLFGGLNIYVFGSESRYKAVIAYCVCLFAIVLFFATELGAYERESGRVTRFEELARQELQIKTIRRNLDLEKDIPIWMTTTEPK